ncbi:MAG TPA: aldo/keto reductase [bacterium]|nr:aldo/keto reductase [bacterium]
MEYTHLGRTGLSVSRLCLGTMNWPWLTTESEAFGIMDHSLGLGINFFDCANVYGGKRGEGLTEQVLGKWFRQGGQRREKVVLATKVYGDMGPWPNQSRLSALHIRQACEDSLKRMNTDHIDLYQMHHIDRLAPWEEVWQAMGQLVQAGKVLYVGSSNFAGWHIAQANEAAKSRHFMGLVSEQSRYNLLCRTPELEVIPACESYGLGLIPWGPLMGGVLAGAAAKAKSGRRSDANAARDLKANLPKVQAYEKFCAKQKLDPAQLALAWLLHQKVVTAPIIGPRTVGQVDTAAAALKIKLSAEQLKKLDEIFPSRGPAPEAYAW